MRLIFYEIEMEKRTHSGAMNRVGSNKFFNIGRSPTGKGFFTVDEVGEVIQKRKPLAPKLFVT